MAGTDETIRIDDAVTADYLDGLRSALADLPSAELAEIVEDARGHLADLAGELGEGYDRDAVHARLGTPAAYAAELRAAAGFPAPPAPERSSLLSARFAVLVLAGATAIAGLGGLMGVPEGGLALVPALLVAGIGVLPVLRDGPRQPSAGMLRPVRALDRLRGRGARPVEPGRRDVPAFVAGLQPGWWVLRGVAAAAVIAMLSTADGSTLLLVTVLLALAAVPLSVALGGRTRTDRRLLWAVVPLNAFAVGLLVSAAGAFAGAGDDPARYSAPNGLSNDGRPVSDVRPFDAQGRPLSGVYLFDEDGTPLATSGYRCSDLDRSTAGRVDEPGPYPQGTAGTDPQTGECTTTPPKPLVVTIPGADPAPAPRPGG